MFISTKAAGARSAFLRADAGSQTRSSTSPAQLFHAIWPSRRAAFESALLELRLANKALGCELETLRNEHALLEGADLMKNEFVLTLAHEVRTPLSTLQMNLDLLRLSPQMPEEVQARRYEVMQRQTTQLAKLVDGLLAATVGQRKTPLQLVPTELTAVVAEAAEMCGAPMVAKEHAITVDTAGPLWVMADRSQLLQVFVNLLQNSARYTPAHGVLAIRVRQDPEFACVEVEDNGIGISEAELPRIFGLFVRGAHTRAVSDGGLGVGLALVKRVVEEHGGCVTAESEGVGRGSRFTVALPRQAVAPAAVAQSHAD
jgi:signal transduction histidine kinase